MRKIIYAAAIGSLVASATSAAQIGEAGYPPLALRDHKEGTTFVTVTIDALGRAKNCIVTKSSGSNELDAASCRVFVTRGRFSPAKNASGEPVDSTFASKVNWKLPPQVSSATAAAK